MDFNRTTASPVTKCLRRIRKYPGLARPAGNALDRFACGAVADFVLFDVQIGGKALNWSVFNLAGVAIVAGIAGLLYDLPQGYPPQKRPDPG